MKFLREFNGMDGLTVHALQREVQIENIPIIASQSQGGSTEVNSLNVSVTECHE